MQNSSEIHETRHDLQHTEDCSQSETALNDK